MKRITPEHLNEIVKLSESVPERYREQCFGLLLSHHLIGAERQKIEDKTRTEEHKVEIPAEDLVIPIDVKAFLGQYSLDVSILRKAFFTEGDQIRPIYKLPTVKKAKAQIGHALMLALETALHSGEFKLNVEALRQRCIDEKSYDKINFITILKGRKNYFKESTYKGDLTLTVEGKTALADTLEELKAQ
jgi:hypothetical protein